MSLLQAVLDELYNYRDVAALRSILRSNDPNIINQDTLDEALLFICEERPLGIQPIKSNRIMMRRLELARLLVRHGANVNLYHPDYWDDDYPIRPKLLFKVTYNMGIFGLLIKHGADIEYANMSGCTPLHYHASTGNIPMVRQLIRRGANIHTVSDQNWDDEGYYGSTPVISAAINGHVEMVKYLLSKGTTLEEQEEEIRELLRLTEIYYLDEEMRTIFMNFLMELDRKRKEKKDAIDAVSRIPSLNTRDIKHEIASYLGPRKTRKGGKRQKRRHRKTYKPR
jgi:hypothetical protein